MTRPLRAAGACAILACSAAMLPLAAGACRKTTPPDLSAVRNLAPALAPRFSPPASGEITPAQIDLFLRARRAGRHGSDIEAAQALGIDPVEFVWVRARVLETLAYLDARRVSDGAVDAYGRSIAVLREARRETKDGRTASRLEADIAALEKERTASRRADPGLAAGARNSTLVAARRAEIDAVTP